MESERSILSSVTEAIYSIVHEENQVEQISNSHPNFTSASRQSTNNNMNKDSCTNQRRYYFIDVV